MPQAKSAEREVQKGMVYLLPFIGANVLPLLTLPILTRILSPTDYGLLALATAYGAVPTGLVQFGLSQGFEREFFKYPEEGRAASLLLTVTGFVTANLLLAGLVTWWIRQWVSGAVLREPGHGVLVMVVFGAMSARVLREFILMYYRNRGEAERYARSSLAEAAVAAALVVYLVAVRDMGVVGIPLGQGLAAVLLLGWNWAAVAAGRPRVDLPALRGALRVGLPLTPRVFVSVAGNHFDKILLGLLTSVAGTGIFAIGQRLSYGVFAYMTALENVFAPRTMKMMFAGEEDADARIGAYLTPFGYLSAAGALLVVLFAEEGLMLLAPAEYSGARIVIALLALNYMIMFFGKQKQLIFAKATWVLPFLSLGGLALNVAVNIPLIQAWGATGAALGTTLAGVVSTWVAVAVSQRYFHIEYQRLRMLASFSVPFLAVASLVAADVSGLGYGFRAGIKGAWLLTFIVVGWRIGILSRENIVVVRRAVRGMGVSPLRTRTPE
jgi:O-antigen/teichoic acid export membrane protein